MIQLINRDGTSTSSYDYDRDGALSQVHIGGGSRPRTSQMGVVSNDGTFKSTGAEWLLRARPGMLTAT